MQALIEKRANLEKANHSQAFIDTNLEKRRRRRAEEANHSQAFIDTNFEVQTKGGGGGAEATCCCFMIKCCRAVTLPRLFKRFREELGKEAYVKCTGGRKAQQRELACLPG